MLKLNRRIGVTPTGPDGTFTRKDHLRGAGRAAATTFGLALVGTIAVDAGSASNVGISGVYAGVFIMCGLGCMLTFVACLAALVQAAVAKK